MGLYDFRRSHEVYAGHMLGIEVVKPGEIELTLVRSEGIAVSIALSAGDAGLVLDSLAAAIKTAEGIS